METHIFLIQLVLILFSARLLGEVANYFKTPSVIGELAAGLIIGPSLLGWVEINDTIQLFAQLGIILLLFEVGLETDIKQLSSAGLKASIVAVAGIIFPLILGFSLSYYVLHISLLASLFIGCTLTATSIGITLRVMRDLKKHHSHEAQIIIGAAVIDDIIGIVLLALLYDFAISGTVDIWSAIKVLLFVVFFFILSPPLVKAAAYAIKQWDKKSEIPGLLPATIVSLVLLFAWIAHALGAPELLGGFAAGIALSRQFSLPFATFLHTSADFTHRVEKQMKPIVHLFTPIFFVAIGLSLNLKSIAWDSASVWIITISLTIVAVIGKLIAAFFLRGESRIKQMIIGTAMVPRGEIGLIFANIGLTAGVLKNDIYTALILVITVTTLVAPFALRWLYSYSPATRNTKKQHN